MSREKMIPAWAWGLLGLGVCTVLLSIILDRVTGMILGGLLVVVGGLPLLRK